MTLVQVDQLPAVERRQDVDCPGASEVLYLDTISESVDIVPMNKTDKEEADLKCSDDVLVPIVIWLFSWLSCNAHHSFAVTFDPVVLIVGQASTVLCFAKSGKLLVAAFYLFHSESG